MRGKSQVREVDIPSFQIVSEKTTEEQILEIINKHGPQTPIQLILRIKKARSTINLSLARLLSSGKLTKKEATGVWMGTNRRMSVYSLK